MELISNRLLYKVYRKRFGESFYAIKMGLTFTNSLLFSKDNRGTIKREINILRCINHKNIINIHSYEFLPTEGSRYRLSFLMDYLDVTLQEKIISKKTNIKKYLKQILEAMVFLENNNIIHGDLKPENIMLDFEDNIKIIDFELSSIIGIDKCFPITYQTLWYRSPELLKAEILKGLLKLSHSIDMWSIGCIFGEMLSGTPIFKGNQGLNEAINQLNRIKIFMSGKGKNCFIKDDFFFNNVYALDLLSKMLVVDPNKRISFKDALKHEYFIL